MYIYNMYIYHMYVYVYIKYIYIYIRCWTRGGMGRGGGVPCPFLKIENSVLILIYTWAYSQKIRKCVRYIIGMWEIDNRLIVSLNKNHKTIENIWYFKTRVNMVSTNTPQISPTNCKHFTSKILLHKFMTYHVLK